MTAPWVAVVVALWVVVILVALVLLGLLRRVDSLLQQSSAGFPYGDPLGGLAPGASVGEFRAVDASGQQWSHIPVDGPAIVLLTAPGCAPCNSLMRALAADGAPLDIPLIVVTTDEETAKAEPKPAWCYVLYQQEGSVYEALRTTATPHAFAMGQDGRVLESVIPGHLEDLRNMARRARHQGGGRGMSHHELSGETRDPGAETRLVSRQTFLRGVGATIVAGAGALMLPQSASAGPRLDKAATRVNGTPTSRSSPDAPRACTVYCRPTNCGNTGCLNDMHIFHCTGCYDAYLCLPHSCSSFCRETQPCNVAA